MRVIGGTFGGRKLTEFENIGVRPTSDMTRESLFNILRDRIEGARVLDLFCGTGAVGIEAISRGASYVVFNDNRKQSLDCLNKNLSSLNIKSGYSVSLRDGLSYLQSVSEKFDIVYLDPPYSGDLGERAIALAEQCLTENGIIVYETDKIKEFKFSELSNFDTRKYGRNVLYFFERKKTACVFAGTFDPITKGHEDIINQCADKFKKVVVTLGSNEEKTPYFTQAERMEFLKLTLSGRSETVIVNYSDVKDNYAEFLKENGVTEFVRGIRNFGDEVYERASIELNKKLYPSIQTVFYKADKKHKKISSSLVREYIAQGKDVSEFVPENCKDAVKKAIAKRR